MLLTESALTGLGERCQNAHKNGCDGALFSDGPRYGAEGENTLARHAVRGAKSLNLGSGSSSDVRLLISTVSHCTAASFAHVLPVLDWIVLTTGGRARHVPCPQECRVHTKMCAHQAHGCARNF